MSDESARTDGRVAAAFARLKNWMLAHAPLLAENLAAGAPTAHLDSIEEKLGFAFPADLRELWLLHDGQTSEQNGFVGALDLFTAEQALSERDGVLMFVDFLQQAPSEWARPHARARRPPGSEGSVGDVLRPRTTRVASLAL
jgi:cell wall assembly regulator SMI1